MANLANLRIGPCTLTWKTQDLGNTLGGIKITYDRKYTDLKVDKYGDTPVDKALTGTDIKITTKVAEPVVSMIQRVLTESQSNSGTLGSNVGLAAGEGALLRQNAGLLVMHPISKGTDTSEDINIYLAVPTMALNINYEVNNQKVYDLEFDALVSEAYVTGQRLGHIGSTTIS